MLQKTVHFSESLCLLTGLTFELTMKGPLDAPAGKTGEGEGEERWMGVLSNYVIVIRMFCDVEWEGQRTRSSNRYSCS